jgi:hypothetical protein
MIAAHYAWTARAFYIVEMNDEWWLVRWDDAMCEV